MLEADAFLRHMVRVAVGTMLLVGRGAWEPARVAALLGGAPRGAAGPTAPAHPLTLVGRPLPVGGRRGQLVPGRAAPAVAGTISSQTGAAHPHAVEAVRGSRRRSGPRRELGREEARIASACAAFAQPPTSSGVSQAEIVYIRGPTVAEHDAEEPGHLHEVAMTPGCARAPHPAPRGCVASSTVRLTAPGSPLPP